MSAGETGWRPGGWPAWLPAWVGDRSTGYGIDPQRSADAWERVIGREWGGVSVHDGWASYDRFVSATHQQCVAHVLRRARELLGTARGGAVRSPRPVITLFTEAVRLRHQYLRGERSAAALAVARGDLEERLPASVAVERAVPADETLADHLWQHLDSWLTSSAGPSVEATNGSAGRAMRPAVVNRKVWGGNRTEAGAEAQGVLTSVAETCKRQTRQAPAFLSQTVRSFGNHLLPQPTLLETR